MCLHGVINDTVDVMQGVVLDKLNPCENHRKVLADMVAYSVGAECGQTCPARIWVVLAAYYYSLHCNGRARDRASSWQFRAKSVKPIQGIIHISTDTLTQ